MANPAQNNPAVGQAAAPAQAQAPAAPAAPPNPLANLPARTERAAPTFNESRPQDLARYFSDLQVLLDRNGIVDDQDCKLAALKYHQVEVENLWKTTRAWQDPNSTYEEFKTEVFKLYPGATGNRTYTIQDLELTIGHYARTGIWNATDLGEYYRRFISISRYLISMNRLSTQEESRTFVRGLQPKLEEKVRKRLQQKFVDHYPDDPHELEEIFEAVSYVLMGSASLGPTTQHASGVHHSPSNNTISSPDPTTVKIEALTAAVASLGEMVKTAFQAQAQPAAAKPRSSGTAAATGMTAPTASACNFCGVPGHYIRECEIVAEYTRLGKCKRSHDGKVVLPSGAMVPRSITGAWLRDRVDEYHRQNPGQMAASMFFEVATAPPQSTPYMDSYSDRYYSKIPDHLHAEEATRIFALNRPTRSRPEIVITTKPPKHRRRVDSGENNGRASSSKTTAHITEEEDPEEEPEVTSPAKKGKRVEFAPEPVHPFANAPDAIHGASTGQVRPAAKEPIPLIGRADPAYTTAAKIHDPRIAKTVYERAMETPITVTQRELLSLSPEVRAQIAEVTIKKRIAREQAAMVMIEEVRDSDADSDFDSEDEQSAPPRSSKAQENHVERVPAMITAAPSRIIPENATIIEDPYEAYLRETADNEGTAEPVHVAAESSALRAILPTVDGQDKIEAILDPGCQIVAMSEEVCIALALPYDPTIRLHMVSANGGVDQSLGLARNVPFLVGDITVYLQVHVLRGPAYDILLGRPFDVLTQSVVRNYSDENQTITILDPNTKRKATVPTIPRGSHRFADRRKPAAKKEADF
jgi:hypothetical protein